MRKVKAANFSHQYGLNNKPQAIEPKSASLLNPKLAKYSTFSEILWSIPKENYTKNNYSSPYTTQPKINTTSNSKTKIDSSTTTPTTIPSQQIPQHSIISCSQLMDNLLSIKITKNVKNLFWYRKINLNRWMLMGIANLFSAIRLFRQNL